MKGKDFIIPIAVAVVLGIGGAVASNDREIAGISEKLDAVHEDVKTIKGLLLQRALEKEGSE